MSDTQSNNVPGLQRSACEDAKGRIAAADTLLAVVPIVNCIGSICVL